MKETTFTLEINKRIYEFQGNRVPNADYRVFENGQIVEPPLTIPSREDLVKQLLFGCLIES